MGAALCVKLHIRSDLNARSVLRSPDRVRRNLPSFVSCAACRARRASRAP